MSLTHQDVARIANLPASTWREEIVAVGNRLNNIFGLIEKMQAVNTDGIEPMAHPQDVGLRLREDIVTQTNQREAFQAIAPQVERFVPAFPRSSVSFRAPRFRMVPVWNRFSETAAVLHGRVLCSPVHLTGYQRQWRTPPQATVATTGGGCGRAWNWPRNTWTASRR
jgi:aspartyl-tRNA(Asn)/glutamyl-tRNA(Gln) amidotransferase subunit C